MAPVFYKILRGKKCGLADLEKIDPTMHKSLEWMLNNSVEGVLFEKFSVTRNNPQGGEEEVALCEGGLQRDVTDENKEEYVELMASWRVQFGVYSQMEALVVRVEGCVCMCAYGRVCLEACICVPIPSVAHSLAYSNADDCRMALPR